MMMIGVTVLVAWHHHDNGQQQLVVGAGPGHLSPLHLATGGGPAPVNQLGSLVALVLAGLATLTTRPALLQPGSSD